MKKTIILCLALALILTGCSKAVKPLKNLKPDQAKAKVTAFVNSKLASNPTPATATVDSVEKVSGVYKMNVKITGGQGVENVEVYSSLDGSKLFSKPLDMNETASSTASAATQGDQAAATAQVTTKTDKPTVQVFVMANCPYGLQMEKGLLPAVQALGKKVDFKLEFCDYSMHGDAEVKEELKQTCIAQTEPTKLAAYLACYWKDSVNSTDSSACSKAAGITDSKLASCISTTDKKYNVTKNLADKTTYKGSYPSFAVFGADNTKYNVGGSPTLVINGETVSASRDSASLLKTICSAFKNAPTECQAQLSSASPSAGFDSQNAGSAGGNAGCATTPAN